jgi:hypothetical protein
MRNNFGLLRLVFAILVIVTHSYPLSGTASGDYLSRVTNNQVDFSFIGLSGFFCYQWVLMLSKPAKE